MSSIQREGHIEWSSPSNLAIVKYWGKHGNQLPRNASLSFTLSNAKTSTSVEWGFASGSPKVEYYFEGVRAEAFEQKMIRFFKKLDHEFPFLKELNLKISSSNTFPHSAGIASSASAMSAMALLLVRLEEAVLDKTYDERSFFQRASHIARLGSGSAARSLYGGWVEWGKHPLFEEYSDLFGTPVTEIHPSFMTLKDTILIVSSEEKSVSSTAGHQLMEDNAYADIRYKQANDNIPLLQKALKDGDWTSFGKIAENEALTLHALMMASEESYLLMQPNSIRIIQKIRKYREEHQVPVYFSLDAGPNIHMLYPEKIEEEMKQFIQEELKELCEGGLIIWDEVGKGPQELS